jgi:hypothetical protein
MSVISTVHRTIQVGSKMEELELFAHDGQVTGILRTSGPGEGTQVYRIEGDLSDGKLTKTPIGTRAVTGDAAAKPKPKPKAKAKPQASKASLNDPKAKVKANAKVTAKSKAISKAKGKK